MITARTTCRACGGPFDPVLNLGSLVLSDFLQPDAPDPPAAPLDLVACQHCELVQLRHTVNPEKLYRTYWYRSGINEAMRAELADVVEDAHRYVTPKLVLDIGANDGTLLGHYPKDSTYRVAVEPARNLETANAHVVLKDFFPSVKTRGLLKRGFDVITSIAMFYDVDEPLEFVAEIDRILGEDGVWIVQFQDLAQQINQNAFDNVCHEHLVYYSAQTFAALLKDFNLHILQVQRRAINGGSLRFVIGRRHVLVQPYRKVLPVSFEDLEHFAWRVSQYKDQLVSAIDRARSRDYVVDLYAASTKSSTLLQYCGIDHRRIRYAVERSPDKVGLVTSGTRIPIIAEEDWRVDPAPLTLLGAWQWKDQFVRREHEYLTTKRGSFLVPLPHVEVVVGPK